MTDDHSGNTAATASASTSPAPQQQQKAELSTANSAAATSSTTSHSMLLAPPSTDEATTLKRKPSATRISVPLKQASAVAASSSSTGGSSDDAASIAAQSPDASSLEAKVASLAIADEAVKPSASSSHKKSRSRIRARPRARAARRRGEGEDEDEEEEVGSTSSAGTESEASGSASSSESEEDDDEADEEEDALSEASRHSSGAKLAGSHPSPDEASRRSPSTSHKGGKHSSSSNWGEIVESDLASQPATVGATGKAPPSGPRNAKTPAAARAVAARNYADPSYVPRGAYWGHDDRSRAAVGEQWRGRGAAMAAGRGRGRGRGGAAFAAPTAPHLAPALRGAPAAAARGGAANQRAKVRGKGEVRGGMLGWSDDEPQVDEAAMQGRAARKIPTAAAISAARTAASSLPAAAAAKQPAWDGPPPPTAPRAMREKAPEAVASASASQSPSQPAQEATQPASAATSPTTTAAPSKPAGGPAPSQSGSPWDSKWTHDGYEALQAQPPRDRGAAAQRGGARGGRISRGGRMSALAASHEGVPRVGSPLARHATSGEDLDRLSSTSPTQVHHTPNGPRESAAAIVADSVGQGPPIVSLPNAQSSMAQAPRAPAFAPIAPPSLVHTPPPPPSMPMMPALPVGIPTLPPGFAVDASGVIYDLTRGAPLAVGLMPSQPSPGAPLTPMGLPAPPPSLPQQMQMQQHPQQHSQQQGGTTYFASTPPPMLAQQQQAGMHAYTRDPPPHQAPRPVAIRDPAAQYAAQQQQGSSNANANGRPSGVPSHARPAHTRSGSSIPASAARVAEFKPTGSSSPLASPGMPAMQLSHAVSSSGGASAAQAQQQVQEERWYAQQLQQQQHQASRQAYETSRFNTPSASSYAPQEYSYSTAPFASAGGLDSPYAPDSPYEFDYDERALHGGYLTAVGGMTHYNTQIQRSQQQAQQQQQQYAHDSYTGAYEARQTQPQQNHQQQQGQQQQQYY